MLQTQIIAKTASRVSKPPVRETLLKPWVVDVNHLGHGTTGDSVMWKNYPLAFQGFSMQLDASLSHLVTSKGSK